MNLSQKDAQLIAACNETGLKKHQTGIVYDPTLVQSLTTFTKKIYHGYLTVFLILPHPRPPTPPKKTRLLSDMEQLYPFMIMLVITQLKANIIIQFWRQYFKAFSHFPTSETQLGSYYQNLNIQVNASRIAERFKTYNYEKSLKSLKPLQWTAKIQSDMQKEIFDICAKKLPKIKSKTFHRKTLYLVS